MDLLSDDVLAKVLSMVARLDCKTATETVPLVCTRWKRVLRTTCSDVMLKFYEVGSYIDTAILRFKSVSGFRFHNPVGNSRLLVSFRLRRIVSRLLISTLVIANK